jgi:signal transduction histidine kinase
MEAAGSLEKSYSQLQTEVSKLRADLVDANAKLSRSLDENTRARAFLTQVLDRLPCGVIVSHSDGGIRLLNPEAERLLALQSAPDSSPEMFVPSEWFTKTISGNACMEYECATTNSPEKRTLSVTVAPLEVAPDSRPEAIWIVQDISQQKRSAAEKEEIRRAQALAEITTVLAHEIRNPLGSMELFTSLVGQATKQSPETHHWVMQIQCGLRSLSATVNNVLQFHGKPCNELIPVRVDQVLEDTVQFLGPLAETKGLKIQLQNLVGPVLVAADSHRLQQAFLNIALNGFRAMPNGGTVTVRIQRAAHSKPEILRIDFEDEGHGIEPCLLEKIFEPGFTSKAGSPGLGLSVCKQVIEEHGGRIYVESRVKQGSTFTIYLRDLEAAIE